MANNMDEFDQDSYDSDNHEPQSKKSMTEAWSSRPMVKLGVIMLVVGAGIAGALGAFSGQQKSETPSRVVAAPAMNEPPGGKSSPYFIEQNKQANEQRAVKALEQGGSSVPTPSGQNIDIAELTNKKDPMMEFRAETERLKQEIKREQQANAQQIMTMQKGQRPEREDDTLAQAMQKQMQVLMAAWEPRKMEHVKGSDYGKEIVPASLSLNQPLTDATLQGLPVSANQQALGKVIVSAGTVNYGQILTEANSDVPGPVLVQIASGPLAGGRAIGQFTVANEHLVIRFSTVVYKGKEYPISAIALDPNTTLAGMATEVDQRYFDRLVLPAAAAFLSGFGEAMGQTPVKTTVTDGGVVAVEQAKKGTKEAIYDSIASVGQTTSRFLEQRASSTKPLVRVAVGTPMGIFFLSSVREQVPGMQMPQQNNTMGGMIASGYQQQNLGYQPQNEQAMPLQQYQPSQYQPSQQGTIQYSTQRQPSSTGSGVYYPESRNATTYMTNPSGVYQTRR